MGLDSSSSFMEAELPSNSSLFAFDGTNSDLARQLYYRAKAGDFASPFDNFNVPVLVQARLEDLDLTWDELPGIAQRALLWDSGFGVKDGNLPVQIWTLGNHSMADLAVPLAQYKEVECTEKVCTQPDNTTSYSNLGCGGAKMLKAARCVVQDFNDTQNVHAAMWVTGGKPAVIPTPRVRKHEWTNDTTDQQDYIVFAIHTVDLEDEPSWSECPDTPLRNGGYGSLVLPCFTTANISETIRSEKKEVKGSAWVSRWLVEDYSSRGQDKFNLVLLAPIIIGILVAVGLFVFIKKRKKETSEDPVEDSSYYLEDGSPCESSVNFNNSTTTTFASSIQGADRTIKGKSSLTSSYGDYTSGSNTILKTLLGSKFLVGKRMAYDKLHFIKALSRGANGEVWLSEYQGQQVAVKRLLQTRAHRADEFEDFALEIELSASLVHPNIISFLGVAWNSLDNLVMVLECLSTGDLQEYLADHTEYLSWTTGKLEIALGVGRALEYLHSQAPPLIHRDLKSKNILLTEKLEPKLIDFGVSRGMAEFTMTAGVGTPYWTAPEILEGKHYTEQADIYSFGVVLSELDTGTIPYQNLLREGKKPKAIQILADVMAGVLRPSFSDNCPARLRRIGELCCQVDPEQRPTAAELVKMLEKASLTVPGLSFLDNC